MTDICPVCFMELPNSGVCDECGPVKSENLTVLERPSAAVAQDYSWHSVARKLIDDHGLEYVKLEWSQSTKNLGQTFIHGFHGPNPQPVKIMLSAKLWPHLSETERTSTILHEIAHALTPGHGHDLVWSRKCREIGGDGRVHASLSHAVHAATLKWVGECPNGHKNYRSRKTSKMFRISCGKCNPVFDRRYLFTWKEQW